MMNTNLVLSAALSLVLGVVAVGCAANEGAAETQGSTESSYSLFNQPQYRMRQAKRLLTEAAVQLEAGTDKKGLIVTARGQVQQGIVYDNTHDSSNEDSSDEVEDTAVKDSIATCAQEAEVVDDVNCLLDAAKTKLSGATKDKGGFRVAAMATIDTAIATDP